VAYVVAMPTRSTQTLQDIIDEVVPERELTQWAQRSGVSPRELYRLRHRIAVPGPLSICLLARATKRKPREIAEACGVEWESVKDRVALLGIR
jgi:hypothetical protein